MMSLTAKNAKRGFGVWLQLGRRCLHSDGPPDRPGSGNSGDGPRPKFQWQDYARRSAMTAQASSMRLRPKGVPTSVLVEGLEEGEHEFAKGRYRDMLDRSAEHGPAPEVMASLSLPKHSVQDVLQEFEKKKKERTEGYGMENLEQMESDRVDLYNAGSSISLHSVMQSTVPSPFNPHGRNPTHLNMPGGGQKAQERWMYGKFNKLHPRRHYSTLSASLVMEDVDRCTDEYGTFLNMCERYYRNCDSQRAVDCGEKTLSEVFAEQDVLMREIVSYYQNEMKQPSPPLVSASCDQNLLDVQNGRKTLHEVFVDQRALVDHIVLSSQSSGSSPNPEVSGDQSTTSPGGPAPENQLSQRQKLQRAVKDYGATVIVFHIGISLMSLGGFYLAVSSGIDLVGLMTKLGVGQSFLESRLATGASTFVVAYAVHKLFAPVRIAVTLTATPFIVRYLRGVGLLKPPKIKGT